MEINKTTDQVPYIGLDLDKDGIVDTIGVLLVDGSKTEKFTAGNPGAVTVSGNMVQPEATLQNNATAPGQGSPLTINGFNRIVLSISGTATARTIAFKVTGPNSIVGYALGAKINADGTVTIGAGTSGTSDEVWQFDGLAGYSDFIAEITSISGGNVTVKAVGVAG